MTKTDYDALGDALRLSLRNRDRLRVYRRLCRTFGARNPQFDPIKFGASMGIPMLFRNPDERGKNASQEARDEADREESRREENFQRHRKEVLAREEECEWFIPD